MEKMKEFFVSPDGTGGGAPNNPANYQSSIFWQRVKEFVEDTKKGGSAIVNFMPGEYRGEIPKLTVGHPEHQLILQGSTPDGAVFIVPEDEPPLDSNLTCEEQHKSIGRPPRIQLNNSENIQITQLHFRGSGLIGTVLYCHDGSKNILIENCTFINMPGVVYAAIGTRDLNKLGTRNITVRKCRFKSIGCDIHAHMMYNSFFVQNILIQDCDFEECSGDYVRFAHETDYCVVQGCVFKHTAEDYSVPRPFISIPVINDCKPGTTKPPKPTDACPDPPEVICPDPLNDPKEYGYFGTHFVFANNRFIYETSGDRRFPIAFIHQGWDPPGRFHLLTADEGNILRNGSPRSKKRLLKRYCGIDTDQIIVYDNVFEVLDGVIKRAAFETFPDYCATSEWQAKGESAVDISDLLNPDPVSQPSQWLEPVLSVLLPR